MSQGFRDSMAVVIIIVGLMLFIGFLVFLLRDQNVYDEKRMIECFDKVKDPKWCYKNL